MVTTRRLEAHRDTAPPVPQPKAVDCVVLVDYAARTLYCRLPDSLTGLGRSHWTQAWQQLKLDEGGADAEHGSRRRVSLGVNGTLPRRVSGPRHNWV